MNNDLTRYIEVITSTLSPREKVTLESRMHDFLALDFWTPAMGAMLVCGLVPPLNAAEVSEGSIQQLKGPESAANSYSAHLARGVLATWQFDEPWLEFLSEEDRLLLESDQSMTFEIAEEYLAEERENLRQKVEAWSKHPTPGAFLSWCEYQYSDRRDPLYLHPHWLGYWLQLAFPSDKPKGDEPVTVKDWVKLVEKVDQFLEMNTGQHPTPQTSASGTDNPTSEYVKKMEVAILAKGRLSIAPTLIKALKACANPRNPSVVFAQIHTWASQGIHSDLRSIQDTSNESVLIPAVTPTWKVYTQKALGQYLRQREIDAGIRVVRRKSSKPVPVKKTRQLAGK